MNHCEFYRAVCLGMLVALLFGVLATWSLLGYVRYIVAQWQKERELKHALANRLNALMLTLALHDIDPERLAQK